jgi:D-alanyl-D-alanine carboxypeptidase
MAKLLHEDRLRGVHPALVLLCKTWQIQLKFDVKVLAGVRTDMEQAALYAQGRTVPGPVVTNAPDATKSPHGMRWVNGRALGCGIDVCPVDAQGNRWDNTEAYEEMADWANRRAEIEWGGHWTHLVDKAHFEILNWKAYPPATTAKPPDMTDTRDFTS